VTIKTPSLVYLSAKAPGETALYAVDPEDKVLLNTVVRVEYDLTRLRESLRQVMGGERVAANTVEGKLVLSGVTSSAGRAERVRALAVATVGEAKAKEIIDQLSVATPNQVNLRVRIAEVKRSALKQLGINWTKFGAGSHFTFATANPTTGITAPLIGPTGTINTASALIGACATGLPGPSCIAPSFLGTLDALTQEELATTLAEPNLTAMNGQTASFLVGGSFPVPTSVNAASAGGVVTIGITYKDFGVKLDFTPTIVDANHLNLKLRPEVSALDTSPAGGAIALPISATSSISVPAVTVTRAETTLELGSGQSFAIAGLLRHDAKQDISKVPALGDIPVLGQLFRSDQFRRDESELVIIVTPYLVNPIATASAMAPTDGWKAPHDLARIVTDDTYRQQMPPAPRGPLNAGGRGLVGPGGFRLD